MKNEKKQSKEVSKNVNNDNNKQVLNAYKGIGLALAIKQDELAPSRTLKNKAKFSNDNVIIRAYETAKGVIDEKGYTKENVFDEMKKAYEKKPLDIQGKDIKRSQRFLASLCCKASGETRSTSSFQQDLKELGKVQCRSTIKTAFPAFEDKYLDIIFKATFLPSRTK